MIWRPDYYLFLTGIVVGILAGYAIGWHDGHLFVGLLA